MLEEGFSDLRMDAVKTTTSRQLNLKDASKSCFKAVKGRILSLRVFFTVLKSLHPIHDCISSLCPFSKSMGKVKRGERAISTTAETEGFLARLL